MKLRVLLGLLLLPSIIACTAGTSHDPAASRDLRLPSAPESAQASARATPQRPAVLALEGEGLRVFTVPSGSARPIPFGTAKADTLAMLAAARDTAPTPGEDPECGATHAYWPDGLWVWFINGAFAGWMVDSAGTAVSTVTGLTVGATRDELADAGIVVTVAPSSLGTEFTAGGMAGLFESDAADARVTHLWAGQPCIMR